MNREAREEAGTTSQLLDILEENDVQAVHANFDISDKVISVMVFEVVK